MSDDDVIKDFFKFGLRNGRGGGIAAVFFLPNIIKFLLLEAIDKCDGEWSDKDLREKMRLFMSRRRLLAKALQRGQNKQTQWYENQTQEARDKNYRPLSPKELVGVLDTGIVPMDEEIYNSGSHDDKDKQWDTSWETWW